MSITLTRTCKLTQIIFNKQHINAAQDIMDTGMPFRNTSIISSPLIPNVSFR